MQQLMVSLDVGSKSITVAELSARLECVPSRDSHSLGERRPSFNRQDSLWDKTIWRLDSKRPSSAPLQEHLASIVKQCPPERLFRPGVLPEDSEVWLSVGVIFDGANAVVPISPKELEIINDYCATLEITCYPGEGA